MDLPHHRLGPLEPDVSTHVPDQTLGYPHPPQTHNCFLEWPRDVKHPLDARQDVRERVLVPWIRDPLPMFQSPPGSSAPEPPPRMVCGRPPGGDVPGGEIWHRPCSADNMGVSAVSLKCPDQVCGAISRVGNWKVSKGIWLDFPCPQGRQVGKKQVSRW